MRNRSCDLPSDMVPLTEAVDAAIHAEDVAAATTLLKECLVQFNALPRSLQDAARYIKWLQETIGLVRVAREHLTKRIVDCSPSYSNSNFCNEKTSRSVWLGILPLLLLLWPAGVPAGDLQSAMEKQTAAAKRQRETTQSRPSSGTFFQTRWIEDSQENAAPVATPTAECDALPSSDLQALMARMSLGSVSPKLVNAVITQESGGKPCAVSSKGAMGLMQIMPDLASDLNVSDPFDPEQNLRAGVRYLAQLSEKYRGDLRLVLAAYNAGPARVDAAGGVPNIAETQGYVKSIMAKMEAAD